MVKDLFQMYVPQMETLAGKQKDTGEIAGRLHDHGADHNIVMFGNQVNSSISI